MIWKKEHITLTNIAVIHLSYRFASLPNLWENHKLDDKMEIKEVERKRRKKCNSHNHCTADAHQEIESVFIGEN